MSSLLLKASYDQVSEYESKQLFKSWIEHLKDNQKEEYPFNVATSFDGIRAELVNYAPESSHSEPIFDGQCGERFGHVVSGFILHAEETEIFPEYYFYSAKDPKHRLACTLNMVLPDHILERMIERMNIQTFKAFKEAIVEVIVLPTMMSTVDQQQVGVDTNYIIVSNDFTLIADIDDGVTTFKTMVSSREYFKGQMRVIEYIINQVGQKYVGLASYQVPETIATAENVLEDTAKRMDESLGYTIETLLEHLYPNF